MEDWEFWSRLRFIKPIVSFCGVYIIFKYSGQQTLSLEWSSLMLQTLEDFMTPLRIQRLCFTCYSGVLLLSGWTPSTRSNLRYWTYLTPCLSNFPELVLIFLSDCFHIYSQVASLIFVMAGLSFTLLILSSLPLHPLSHELIKRKAEHSNAVDLSTWTWKPASSASDSV